MIHIAACPVCDAPVEDARVVHVRADDKLVLCPRCGLIFANPQYGPAELKRIYEEDYYDEKATLEKGKTIRGFSPNRRTYEIVRGTLVRRYPRLGEPGVAVLDYGCGLGGFLDVMREHGADVVGIEFSEIAARYVREKIGIDVSAGAEDALEQEADGRFDLIVLMQVLEHLREPGRVVELAFRKLKCGGVTYVEVPNTHALAYMFLKGRWSNAQERAHFALYNKSNLVRSLSKAGFQRTKRLVFWGGRPGFGPFLNLCQYFVRMLGFGGSLIVTAEKP